MVSDESTTEVLEVEQEKDDKEMTEDGDENETLWLRQYRGRPGDPGLTKGQAVQDTGEDTQATHETNSAVIIAAAINTS